MEEVGFFERLICFGVWVIDFMCNVCCGLCSYNVIIVMVIESGKCGCFFVGIGSVIEGFVIGFFFEVVVYSVYYGWVCEGIVVIVWWCMLWCWSLRVFVLL